jgi:hypothetical protein
MSEGDAEAREDRQNVPGPTPTLGSTERMFLRLSFWQTVLSVVGVFIAVVALYAALTESEAVRQQTAAAVWPFVQISVADFDTGEAAGFTLSFKNSGVGPARVRTLRVIIDGKPMRDWEYAVAHLGGTLGERVGRSFVSDRVLSPEEQVDLISITDPALARKFQRAIANPQNAISYCYCSIFDDCWLADSRRDALSPEPVEQCPDFGDATFRN